MYLLVLFHILQSLLLAAHSCPSLCSCLNGKGGIAELRLVQCSDPGITAVPISVPADTVKLRLEKTLISKVSRAAFYNLSELRFLWLTYNSITLIHPSSFVNLKALRELRLDGNLLTSFPWEGLRDMPRLQTLGLHNNRLSSLPAHAALFLPNITYLDLSSNRLTILPAELLDLWFPLPGQSEGQVERRILGLHDNPWLCDCQISMLMSLSMTLGSTVVLMDQLLMCSKSLSQSELLQTQAELSRCMRPSVQPATTRVISPMGSNVILRCDATGYPTPTLTWIKTSTYTNCCQQDILDNSEQLPRILESCGLFVLGVTMVDSLDMEKQEKRYFIQRKHAVIICITVVLCCLAVGLGVGLSRSNNTTPAATTTPAPTAGPTQPPSPGRGPCLPSTDSSGDWRNFRLPDYVNPVHYDLHLELNLEDDTYTGTVDIQLEVTKPTRHLWLHIRETFVSTLPRLKVLSSQGGQREVAVKSCFEYKAQQYVVVEATEELPVSDTGEVYILSLDFQGWLNGSLVGFYRVTYMENGITKKIAATDHEPTDARKSFPCFDEPNKKATYTISITRDANYKVLSNMPAEGSPQALPGNKIKTTFQKSVPMSTYLVCFAVHQFDYVERTSARGIPLKIWAQPSQISTALYAANVTKVIFDYFEEYFNMTYSISKLDEIAIPDFGTGAMENWGLITYRETNLLYDENQSSSYNKQRVASVIAHELVHQWFGNIVTMDWWDDLWLNEGFASFFEYIGVELAEPTWGMRDIMIISDVLPVMVDDALLSSHPIIVDVSTPAEITSVFDAISYSKGASILRMLEDWMGRDKFRDGCRKYLKDFYFKNAKTSDFWASLASAGELPIADVMDTWTKQMGYPVLDLSVSDTDARLSQKRFLLDPKADTSQPPSDLGYKWTIPVQWHSVQSDKNMSLMFDKNTAGLACRESSQSRETTSSSSSKRT